MSASRFFALILLALPVLFPAPLSAQQQQAQPFVSAEWADYYRRLVPTGIFTPAELDRAVFYDRAHVPPVYQDWTARTGLLGVFRAADNVSADRSEPFGNANREFPWNTGGMDKSPNGWDFKFYLPPADGKKMVGHREVLSRTNGVSRSPEGDRYLTGKDDRASLICTYPKGCRFVEVLLVRTQPLRRNFVFEVRVMTRKRDGGSIYDVRGNWDFKVYRAVRSADHLRRILRESQDQSHRPYRDSLERHYEGTFRSETLENPHHVKVFSSTATVDPLPELPESVVAFVLGRGFEDVTDRPWIETQSHKGFAARGGIFPREYQGNHFHSKNCADCHQTVLKHAGDFQLFRDWYGRSRGSDGVFSFAMIDPSSVSRQDARQHGRPILWDRRLIEAGLMEERATAGGR